MGLDREDKARMGRKKKESSGRYIINWLFAAPLASLLWFRQGLRASDHCLLPRVCAVKRGR
jgi:hypothetical protein